MTQTTVVTWHDDRPFIHFGSPADATYWVKPEEKRKKKSKKRKKNKR